MINIKQNKTNTGSSLIAVIIITVVSITVVGAMVILVSIVLLSTVGWQKSADALFTAESYADDYVLRLVRNPKLTPKPGEKLIMNDSVAYPTLFSAPNGQPNILFVQATSGGYSRSIRLIYVVNDGQVEIVDRSEVAE